MSTLTWWPSSCVLQLNLSKGSPDGVLRAGSVYSGTSTIRYVKREPMWTSAAENPESVATQGAAVGAGPSSSSSSSSLSAHDQFLRAVSTASGCDGHGGLPLHAYTHPSPRYPAVTPLQVQSYKITDTSGSPLKLLSVVELDAGKADDTSVSSKAGGKGKTKGASATTSSHNSNNGKKKGATMNKESESPQGAADAHADADDDAINVVGAKWVAFQGAATLPAGTEVELTVTFTGAVQESDQGGLYAAPGGDGDAVLTHFEVSLARFAFPCPDHPQYRLDWCLKTLQLPQTYIHVITNGTEQSRKVLAAQEAVQVSYSACGPMPAYVFAFACFRSSSAGAEAPSPLLSCEDVVSVPSASAYRDADGASDVAQRSGSSEAQHLPLRVLATRQSGVPLSVLEQSLKVAQDAIRLLQDFFQCPLPLLQCGHVDILLAPTMPYISGMEHHGCIFLNESIFQSKGKKPAAPLSEEQITLIVHELAHHWMGNALGLPFSVKEGICQLLEQCFADVIAGRPMRKYHAGEAESDSQTQETVQGKEFTGHTYQHALLALQRLVATAGFATFQTQCRALARVYLLEPMLNEEDYGGLETLRLSSAPDAWPVAPYLSTTDAMQVLHGHL